MFDVFYLGQKPNQFPHEQQVDSLEQAQQRSRTRYCWVITYLVDYTGFDFLWEPLPWESQFRHAWPSQHCADSETYLLPAGGWTGTRYHSGPTLTRIADRGPWHIPNNIDVSTFDFSWHPDPTEPPYVYDFGTQWQKSGGPKYTVPGATEVKYVSTQRAVALPTDQNWIIPDNINVDNFDFSWHPDPTEPPYVYDFGTQWQKSGGPKYTVPGAVDVKYVDQPRARSLPTIDPWHVPDNIDASTFDFSWHPDPTEPPYVYEFGTQWYSEGGPRYCVPGAVDVKYVDQPRAWLKPTQQHWRILCPIDLASFDWSWAPHPREEPYIYVWGNQHWPAEQMSTVEYHAPGATQRKYMPGGPRLLPQKQHWSVPDNVDPDSVDFTWCPDPGDPPYVYEFATQWQPNGGACYSVPGATERKYLDSQIHVTTQNQTHWTDLEVVDGFDRSWHPSNTEEPYIYVFGNQHYPAEIMPTVIYTVPGATERKFMDQPRARLSDSRLNWEVLESIDESQWDWSWRPNPFDPPYVYVFGNQWHSAEIKASLRYQVPGATEVKYMAEPRTCRLGDPDKFDLILDVSSFDYSWEPDPGDPPYVYVFGNQWNCAQVEPTVLYTVPGATERKYVNDVVATVSGDRTRFEPLDEVEDFDWSWRPNPFDPPYVYVFGNQWLTPEQRPALRYRAPGATEIKYMTEPRARRRGDPDRFHIQHNCDFDWSWEPDPGDPPYVYVFGNQWYPAETMPTVEYRVLGATERKYMTEPRATLPASDEHWAPVTDQEFEFDRSWCPDPGDPPYVYVFGNQWHAAEVMPTIEYHVPGATERKFMDHPRACLLSDPAPWSVPEELDPDNIDFSWCPDPGSPPFVYHFGTDYQATVGLTYTVPGATALKFAGEVPRIKQAQPVVTVLEIFYLDHSNAASAARFDALQQRYPTVQRVRYVGSILDTVRRCAARATGSKFWVISSRNDYTDFDFAWHAQPWQASMTHVFGTQWNKWSDTFLINRWEFERHSRWASGIEQFPNLNFVSDQQVVSPQDATDIFVIDHGDSATVNYLSGRYRVVRSVRYFDNYLDTLARVVADCDSEYVWVVSGLCDYTWFDFSWQPEAWQRDMLHVFPSNEQRFGDTFYIPVQRFREQIDRLERLDCFETVNFCADQSVPRWPMPVIQHDQDSHVDAVLQYDRADPVAIFTGRPIDPRKVPTISMWDERARTIIPLDSGASTVIVPKSAIPRIRTQLYDYPYIDKTHRGLFAAEPLDIVFISNGESTAAAAFEALEKSTVGRSNRIHRVDGVTGRVAAYHAAARTSTTPWFFAVFAKLFVNSQFDWSWQPDRMQQAKHYIFHARNPVNDLEYGHQAMIAYNRDLTLANPGHGLDFTLDDAHEVVPVLSGVALYADTPWMAWRTAFREALKLRASLPDVENEFRLSRWLAASQVRNGDWSQWGAKDAVEYYDTVSGDPEQLRLSYEWAWLATYAFMKRKLVPDP